MTFLKQLRMTRDVGSTARDLVDLHAGAIALDERNEVYNEETFQYFLGIEQKRSARSKRPVLLLLLSLTDQAGIETSIDASVAARLFSALWQCLRETDFVGWHREGRVAGAVLTHCESGPGMQFAHVVGDRLRLALRSGLHSDPLHRLKVRVHLRPPTLKDRS
jgi:hypothetical protein